MRWSIRTKILIILSTLLLVVVFAYLVLAEKIFREDKELLVFDTNRSATEQLANELDGYLRRIVDKMELLSELILNEFSNHSERKLAQALLNKDPDLVAMQLIYPQKKDHPLLGQLVSQEKLNKLDLTVEDLQRSSLFSSVLSPAPIQIEVENRSNSKILLYLIRVPIQLSGQKNNPSLYAQTLIDGRILEDTFQSNQTLATRFTANTKGDVLTHPNQSLVTSHQNLSTLKIVKEAQTQNFLVQQMEFEFENKNYLGAYRKTALGSLIAVSMIDKSTARLASRLLLEKTILLSLIIITTVLLISLFFSGTLTTPLLRLVEATRKISQGNFEAPIEIKTQDEIGILANAFAQMVQDLKSSRQLLEQSNRELEEKVSKRTQELEDKSAAIRQHQDALLKSTRLATVGEIAGQAAHEVLNPLTGMIASLESIIEQSDQMLKGPSTPLSVFHTIISAWNSIYDSGGFQFWVKDLEKPSKISPGKKLIEEDLQNLNSIQEQMDLYLSNLRATLSIILSESYRIARIIDRMRGIDRIQRVTTTLDLKSLISDCLRSVDDLLSRYKIQTETQFDPGGTWIKVDKDEIWQVFSNLIKNSIDAIQEARKQIDSHRNGRIRISARSVNDSVLITFWDNGIGIPKENWDRIFEIHFSTKGAEGTGYGLGLCRRFLRANGGEIALKRSDPGCFSEFEIKLPKIGYDLKDAK